MTSDAPRWAGRRYRDFVLQLETLRLGRYRALVVESPAGEAQADFKVQWTVEELSTLWGELEKPAAGQAEGSLASEAVRRFGGRLFRTVFSGQIEAAFRTSLNETAARGESLRLRLRLKRAPELAGLPWEYLYDEDCEQFLALMPEISLVRHPEMPKGVRLSAGEPPIRVLAWIANPPGSCLLDASKEWESIVRALEPLVRAGRLILERIEGGTLTALRQALRRGDVHAVHFVGHGAFDPSLGDGYLLLEDDEGWAQKADGRRLGTLLGSLPTLRLVVLNACEGGRRGPHDSFSGVAQSLVQMAIPAVVAMQFPVSDRAAIRFSQEFYETLANGALVDEALAEARKTMALAPGELEWGAPVLYLRPVDVRLVDSPATPSVPKTRLWPIRLGTRGRRRALWGGVALGIVLAIGVPLGRYIRNRPSHRLADCPGLARSSIQFLQVPAGSLGANEGPLCVAKFELTEKQWQEIESGLPGESRGDDFPVTNVSLDEARRFADKLSRRSGKTVRLPTEAEWEAIARAGTHTKYFFGDAPTELDRFGNCAEAKGAPRKLSAVGHFAANLWGFYDVYGNVWEWVETPPLANGDEKWIRRGGAFDISPQYCNSTHPGMTSGPYSKQPSFGLRLAYEP